MILTALVIEKLHPAFLKGRLLELVIGAKGSLELVAGKHIP